MCIVVCANPLRTLILSECEVISNVGVLCVFNLHLLAACYIGLHSAESSNRLRNMC